ncbi:MAG TPA: hypothetical protein VHA52_10510, partial [Candidatus Babeliaceae bacterium]|nr:hypothetical protein [Candidatus Babeliaceae bacterium]
TLSVKKEKWIPLANAVLEAFNLFKMSQVPWIKFEQMVSRPFSPRRFAPHSIWAKEGDQQSIQHLKLESYFLVSNPLPQALRAIYEYCTHFFDQSTWQRVCAGKKCTYEAVVQWVKPPFMSRLTAWAKDSSTGWNSVKISTR